MKFRITAVIITGLFIASCSNTDSVSKSENSKSPAVNVKNADPFAPRPAPKRVIDYVKVARGEELYLENCVKCHEPDGKGKPNWKVVDKDGKYPPPPLNDDGHAWHHSAKILMEYIQFGSKDPRGNMKGFKDKLNDDETEILIEWIKSKWSDEIYTAWYWRDLEAREREKKKNGDAFSTN